MSITRPKPKPTIEEFISGAPDAVLPLPQGVPEPTQRLEGPKKAKHVKKGKKLQITLTITEPLLARVDELAAKIGQSRAAVINLAIYQGLESGLSIDQRKS